MCWIICFKDHTGQYISHIVLSVFSKWFILLIQYGVCTRSAFKDKHNCFLVIRRTVFGNQQWNICIDLLQYNCLMVVTKSFCLCQKILSYTIKKDYKWNVIIISHCKIDFMGLKLYFQGFNSLPIPKLFLVFVFPENKFKKCIHLCPLLCIFDGIDYWGN